MASILGVSERRLRQLVEEGMPRIGSGLYPLAACVQWYLTYWRDRAQSREGDVRLVEKRDLENALLRKKYEEATGHLITRKEVVMATSAAYSRLGKMLDSLSSSITREFNLATDVARVWRARTDEAREGFVTDLKEYIDKDIVQIAKELEERERRAAKKRA